MVNVRTGNLRRTQLLDTESSQPLSHIDSSLKALALDKTSNETTSKSITSTVSIIDLLLLNSMNRVLLWSTIALSRNNSWEGSLSDNSNTPALVVLFWQISKVLRNLGSILSLQTMGLSVSKSLALVTDNDIPVWSGGIKRILEELADEWRGERDNEGFVVLCRLLGNSHDRLRADGEVVTTDIDELGVLDQLPYLRLSQVLDLVVVGGGQISAHGAVVAGDDNTAATGRVLRVDAVFDAEASLLICLLEDGGVLVVTDAAYVDNGAIWKNVLGTASSVLGSSTGDKLGVVVVEEVLVEAKVLLLGEDGIVLIQLILVEESLVTSCLDV